MTDTKEEPAPMTANQRARIAALEVMTIMLLRRIAAGAKNPREEIDDFRRIALAESADAAKIWQAPEDLTANAILGLCQDAEDGLR